MRRSRPSAQLLALPAEPFDPARLLQARVDNRSRVSVRQSFYSVPVRYVGRRLHVRLTGHTVEVLDGAKVVARHERAFGRYVEVLALDHYLEVLKTKPGGLPGATALAQAKAKGTFTASHQAYWDAVRRARGDAAGTRALIEILLAHRTLPAPMLTAAMDRAVASRLPGPAGRAHRRPPRNATHLAPVIPIGALARYDRPAPSLTAYDQLLTGSQPHDHHHRRRRRASRHRRRRPRTAPAHRPRRIEPAGRDRGRGNDAPTWATSPKSWPPRSTTAANAAAPAASARPNSPASNDWPSSTWMPSDTIAPATLAHLATGAYMTAGEPVVLLGPPGAG